MGSHKIVMASPKGLQGKQQLKHLCDSNFVVQSQTLNFFIPSCSSETHSFMYIDLLSKFALNYFPQALKKLIENL